MSNCLQYSNAIDLRSDEFIKWKIEKLSRLTEDPLITQLRVADEEILAQMEQTGTNFGKYDALVIDRHKLYLKYEKQATDSNTRYLISTIRQNILTQIKVSVLEAEIVKLSIRVENLEKKSTS